MLRIYAYAVETLKMLVPVLDEISKRDVHLRDQMREAGASIVMNIGEGMGSRGRLRQARYNTALGSAREVVAGVDVAEAYGYVKAVRPEVRARMNRIIGTLVKLV